MDFETADRAVRSRPVYIEIMGSFAITIDGKRYTVPSVSTVEVATLIGYLALYPESISLTALENAIDVQFLNPVINSLCRVEILEREGNIIQFAPNVSTDIAYIRHVYNLRDRHRIELSKAVSLCRGRCLPGIDAAWVITMRRRIERIVLVLRKRLEIALNVEILQLERELYLSQTDNTHLRSMLDQLQASRYQPLLPEPITEQNLPRLRLGDPLPSDPPPLLAPAIFVGRDSEVATVVRMLQNEPKRWVTITGAAGIGKTAIALVAGQLWATSAAGRTVTVSMEGIASRDQLYTRLTQALALGTPDTIRASVPIEQLIVQQLRASKTLLVLDGCQSLSVERLIELQMLVHESGVSVLATACRRLFGIEQHVQRFDPLSRDDAFQLIMLLVARSNRKNPIMDRQALSGLLDLCGGVPRVIEIAVGMTETWPLEKVVSSFRSGDHEEGSGLRWLVDSSLARISPEARETFAALSHFVGSFSLTDATAVLLREGLEAHLAELDYIGLIVERQGSFEMSPAFRPLASKLATPTLASVHLERYIHHYADLAETHARDLIALGPHVANIKNALQLALASGELFAYDAARIAMSLPTYWVTNRALEEAAEVLGTVAGMHTFSSLAPSIRAGVLGNLGVMHLSRAQYAEAVSACKRGLPAARLAGDVSRLGAIASNLAGALVRLDREMESLPYHEEAVAALRALGDPERLALALQNASAAHVVARSYKNALVLATEGEGITKNDHCYLLCRLNAAEALYGLGRLDEAGNLARKAAIEGIERNDFSAAALCLLCFGITTRNTAILASGLSYLRSVGDNLSTFAKREMQALNLSIEPTVLLEPTAKEALCQAVLTL